MCIIKYVYVYLNVPNLFIKIEFIIKTCTVFVKCLLQVNGYIILNFIETP